MPNWVYSTMIVTSESQEALDEFKKAASKENYVSEYPADEGKTFWKIFQSIIPVPEQTEHFDWYGWALENWGCKWGDCHTELIEDEPLQLIFTMDFPWQVPFIGMQRISNLYPELKFQLDMDEEGGFFWGSMTFQGGKVIVDDIKREPSPRLFDEQQLEEMSK